MRIWTTNQDGRGEHRELDKVTKNKHGDLCFSLNRGECWQFSPRWECLKFKLNECNDDCRKCLNAQTDRTDWPKPKPEDVDTLGFMESAKPDKKPFWSVLILRNPERVFYGNMSNEPEPAKPERKRKPRTGDKGGRPTMDGDKREKAIQDVLKAMRGNASLSLDRACEFAVKENGLTIKKETLATNIRRRQRKRTN